MRLRNQVAIVTGASRGIGRAIAIGFAREGASIVVNFNRSRDAAEQVASGIRNEGGKAVAVHADVSDPAHHDLLVSAALDTFGALHILVNNAGIEINEPVLESRPSTWDQTMDANLKGAYFLSVKAAEAMCRAGGGSIVNISSVHDVEPLRNRAMYSISKAGMLMMTKSLALELAAFQIRVNAVSPGAIFTDMNRKHLSEPERRGRLVAQIPLQRIGDAEDIVGAAVYLASSESGYVTGTTVYVDGGLLLHHSQPQRA